MGAEDGVKNELVLVLEHVGFDAIEIFSYYTDEPAMWGHRQLVSARFRQWHLKLANCSFYTTFLI